LTDELGAVLAEPPQDPYRPLDDDIDRIVARVCLEAVRGRLIDEVRQSFVLDPPRESLLFREAARLSSMAVRRTEKDLLLAALGAMFVAHRIQGAYAFPGTLSVALDAATRIGVSSSEILGTALQSTSSPLLHSLVRHFLTERPPVQQKAEANDWIAVGDGEDFRYVRMTYAVNHLGLVEEVSRARKSAGSR
jgi:hypothetical protein